MSSSANAAAGKSHRALLGCQHADYFTPGPMTNLAMTQELIPIFPSESAFVVPFGVSSSYPPLRIIGVVEYADHVVDVVKSHAGKSNPNC